MNADSQAEYVWVVSRGYDYEGEDVHAVAATEDLAREIAEAYIKSVNDDHAPEPARDEHGDLRWEYGSYMLAEKWEVNGSTASTLSADGSLSYINRLRIDDLIHLADERGRLEILRIDWDRWHVVLRPEEADVVSCDHGDLRSALVIVVGIAMGLVSADMVEGR